MDDFLSILASLDRKERYFIVTEVLDRECLQPGPAFRQRLSEATGLDIPASAVAYIDYHIDWVHAAVEILRDPTAGHVRPNRDTRVSTGNQEDIDLIVAYEDDDAARLVMVEAKAETGWTNKQLVSKAARLAGIFGMGEIAADAQVKPTFCLWSPRRTRGLRTDTWPRWMLPDGPAGREVAWMPLSVPAGRRQVMGCDIDGRPSRDRDYWRISP